MPDLINNASLMPKQQQDIELQTYVNQSLITQFKIIKMQTIQGRPLQYIYFI
ncbi:MAG: hypothetical protein ACJA13_003796 [Paraglaciecola sp.]|jgi:hypothetical protein